jgi:hypothetical protein
MFKKNTSKKPNNLINYNKNNNNLSKSKEYISTIENKDIDIKLKNHKDYMLAKYKYHLCNLAIKANKINVLRWALDNGFDYNDSTCEVAIDENNKEALKMIINKFKKNRDRKNSIFSSVNNYSSNNEINFDNIIKYAKKQNKYDMFKNCF